MGTTSRHRPPAPHPIHPSPRKHPTPPTPQRQRTDAPPQPQTRPRNRPTPRRHRRSPGRRHHLLQGRSPLARRRKISPYGVISSFHLPHAQGSLIIYRCEHFERKGVTVLPRKTRFLKLSASFPRC